jgi:hypothetical protein
MSEIIKIGDRIGDRLKQKQATSIFQKRLCFSFPGLNTAALVLEFHINQSEWVRRLKNAGFGQQITFNSLGIPSIPSIIQDRELIVPGEIEIQGSLFHKGVDPVHFSCLTAGLMVSAGLDSLQRDGKLGSNYPLDYLLTQFIPVVQKKILGWYACAMKQMVDENEN